MEKILIIDDEEEFRNSLSKRLNIRGLENLVLGDGEEAVKTVRGDPDIDVVFLDRKMPGMPGEEVLRELKACRPELQVIMLTGYSTTDSAVKAGKLDAFKYLEKPCDIEKIVETVRAARVEKAHAIARHEIPHIEKGSLKKWLAGTHNYRPGFIMAGALVFLAIVLMPTPGRLSELLSFQKTKGSGDLNMGYFGYMKMKTGESIRDFYVSKHNLAKTEINKKGEESERPLTIEETAFRTKVMLGLLVIAALFWASGAIPIGMTALLVGVVLYFFRVLEPDDIAKAYAQDEVIFIFGVLALASAIGKTGLDRRIGLLLLGPSTSIMRYLFLFLPLMAVSCSFLSEHALVAFIMPVIMVVYASSIRETGVSKDYNLAVMLVLSLCFAANCGGPGSPAAGGRNAIMMGILSDYGHGPTFGQWVIYGLPFVPVMALVIGTYFLIVLYPRTSTKKLNLSLIVKQASRKIGPMNRNEYITAAVLVGLIVLWITKSDVYGMGGPVILAIVVLNVLKVIGWRDITKIQWEVVALYASACALGKGLAATGAALYLGRTFIDLLPGFMKGGEGLAVAASVFTGVTTNFMSDGATVSAIGPITVPMAIISGTPPLMVGFATAFASSFAHMLIIGTPNNAIAYAMSKDPMTGENMVKLSDFLKHGAAILVLSLFVLWGWTIFGYWRWIGF
ncbi:SLC13 family permease [Fibrobacterota bacterium]